MKNKIVHIFIIIIFVSLYLLVATISMINSVDFFNMSHNGILSWSLALGFELGAAASLAAIIILDKTNKNMVWGLFLLLTAFQMMANSYHAFVNLEDYKGWIELFGLTNEEEIMQKRILSIVSGAVLPIVALGFIKSLIDYIKPVKNKQTNKNINNDIENKKPIKRKIKSKPIKRNIKPNIKVKDLVNDNKKEEKVKDIVNTEIPVVKKEIKPTETKVNISPKNVNREVKNNNKNLPWADSK